jgi:hypothetical protein
MELQNNYPPNYTASHSKNRNNLKKNFLFATTRLAVNSILLSGVSKRQKTGSVYTHPSIIKISNDWSFTTTSLYSFKVRCLRTRENLLFQLTEAIKNYITIYFIVPSVSQYRYINKGVTGTQHA